MMGRFLKSAAMSGLQRALLRSLPGFRQRQVGGVFLRPPPSRKKRPFAPTTPKARELTEEMALVRRVLGPQAAKGMLARRTGALPSWEDEVRMTVAKMREQMRIALEQMKERAAARQQATALAWERQKEQGRALRETLERVGKAKQTELSAAEAAFTRIATTVSKFNLPADEAQKILAKAQEYVDMYHQGVLSPRDLSRVMDTVWAETIVKGTRWKSVQAQEAQRMKQIQSEMKSVDSAVKETVSLVNNSLLTAPADAMQKIQAIGREAQRIAAQARNGWLPPEQAWAMINGLQSDVVALSRRPESVVEAGKAKEEYTGMITRRIGVLEGKVTSMKTASATGRVMNEETIKEQVARIQEKIKLAQDALVRIQEARTPEEARLAALQAYEVATEEPDEETEPAPPPVNTNIAAMGVSEAEPEIPTDAKAVFKALSSASGKLPSDEKAREAVLQKISEIQKLWEVLVGKHPNIARSLMKQGKGWGIETIEKTLTDELIGEGENINSILAGGTR